MSNVEIGYVFSDVDGTLLAHNQDPSEKVQAAVRDVNVPFGLATGRSLALAKGLFMPLHLRGINVLDIGASITKAPSGEYLETTWLAAQTGTEIVRGVGHLATLLSCEAEYKPFDPREIDTENYVLINDSPSIFGECSADNTAAIEEFLATVPGISYRILKHGGRDDLENFQVTREGIDKGSGLHSAMKQPELEGKRPLVIDDDLRGGIPLFEAAKEYGGITVAMGNAPKELKYRADYITDSVHEDGVVKALKRYRLIG